MSGRPITRALRGRARQAVLRFRPRFRQEIEDPDVPLSFDMGHDSRTLLIAFGGLRGQLGMPVFEFFKTTGGMSVKRLFVRDLRQAWYHRGIPGHGETIEEVAQALGELIAAHDVERLVMAGNSAGGYAALLFGTLLGADAVLCFAPQSTLELDALEEMKDHRWIERVRELTEAGAMDPQWTDLRSALAGKRREGASCELYFDDSFEVDRLHAERLEGMEGLRLHRVEGGDHLIVRQMRETGQLEQVLRRALMAQAPGAPAQ